MNENYRGQYRVREIKRMVDEGLLVRLFMGEPRSVYTQYLRVREDVAGEQVATTILQMENAIGQVDLTFVTKTESKRFPETTFTLEGTKGTLELKTDFWVHLTKDAGTLLKNQVVILQRI